jgi:hypothetical protein
MNFLPVENLTFKTTLSQVEVINRLKENIEPEKALRFGLFRKDSSKPYEGYLTEKYFNIKRIIGYRNSFLPRINGSIKSENRGTNIKVKMQLQTLVKVFLGIWCLGVGIGFMAILISTISKNKFEPVIFIPLGMLLFAYLLTLVGFKAESSKSINDLERIIDGRRIS